MARYSAASASASRRSATAFKSVSSRPGDDRRDADRHRQRAFDLRSERKRLGRDHLANALGQLRGLGGIRLRQQNGQLIAAEACGRVHAANLRLDAMRDLLERIVARPDARSRH